MVQFSGVSGLGRTDGDPRGSDGVAAAARLAGPVDGGRTCAVGRERCGELGSQ